MGVSLGGINSPMIIFDDTKLRKLANKFLSFLFKNLGIAFSGDRIRPVCGSPPQWRPEIWRSKEVRMSGLW